MPATSLSVMRGRSPASAPRRHRNLESGVAVRRGATDPLLRRICRALRVYGKKGIWYNVGRNEDVMGLVKTRRLMAMQKQQRAKAGMKPQMKKGGGALPPHLYKSGGSVRTVISGQLSKMYRPFSEIPLPLSGF